MVFQPQHHLQCCIHKVVVHKNITRFNEHPRPHSVCFHDSIFHIIALETTVKNIVMDLISLLHHR